MIHIVTWLALVAPAFLAVIACRLVLRSPTANDLRREAMQDLYTRSHAAPQRVRTTHSLRYIT